MPFPRKRWPTAKGEEDVNVVGQSEGQVRLTRIAAGFPLLVQRAVEVGAVARGDDLAQVVEQFEHGQGLLGAPAVGDEEGQASPVSRHMLRAGLSERA